MQNFYLRSRLDGQKKKNNLAPPRAKETGVSLLACVQAGQLLHGPRGGVREVASEFDFSARIKIAWRCDLHRRGPPRRRQRQNTRSRPETVCSRQNRFAPAFLERKRETVK